MVKFSGLTTSSLAYPVDDTASPLFWPDASHAYEASMRSYPAWRFRVITSHGPDLPGERCIALELRDFDGRIDVVYFEPAHARPLLDSLAAAVSARL